MAKLDRVHGETFLTRPRWTTKSASRARLSPFQWRREGSAYTLSLLGVVNGPLSWTRIVLVATMDDRGVIQGYDFKRRWW